MFEGRKMTNMIHSNNQIEQLSALHKGIPFSFTLFSSPPTEILGYVQSDDIIVEQDGVFSISDKIRPSSVNLDPTFKQLVDSILL